MLKLIIATITFLLISIFGLVFTTTAGAQTCPTEYPRCENYGVVACVANYGIQQNCTTSGGESGTCCLENVNPQPCPADHLCYPRNTIPNQTTCQQRIGIWQQCTLPSGNIGHCCVPSTVTSGCNSNETCIQDIHGCTNGRTVPTCITSGGSQGNCCIQNNPPNSQPINFSGLIQVTLPNIQNATIGEIIAALFPFIFQGAGIILLIYLVYGGYEIMTSQSDPKRIASGQQRITYAIVGFIIIFVSYWLVRLAGEILGIQAITDIFN